MSVAVVPNLQQFRHSGKGRVVNMQLFWHLVLHDGDVWFGCQIFHFTNGEDARSMSSQFRWISISQSLPGNCSSVIIVNLRQMRQLDDPMSDLAVKYFILPKAKKKGSKAVNFHCTVMSPQGRLWTFHPVASQWLFKPLPIWGQWGNAMIAARDDLFTMLDKII